MGDALGETPLSLWGPGRHCTGRGWKACAFANAEQDAGKKKRNHATRGAHPSGRQADDQGADSKRYAGAEPVADRTAQRLKHGIGNAERRKYQAKIGVAEAEVRL